MSIAQPSWYRATEHWLESYHGLTSAVLLIIAAVCVALVLWGREIPKVVFATYLLMP